MSTLVKEAMRMDTLGSLAVIIVGVAVFGPSIPKAIGQNNRVAFRSYPRQHTH
jgi:CBS domain containing-hemolysin-like protein